jgi:hypothetical protein
MKNQKWKIILMALAVSFGTGIWWRASANSLLREERTQLRMQVSDITRLREATEQKKASVASLSETEQRRRDADETAALLSRIEDLKAAYAKFTAPNPAPASIQKKKEEIWRNAGQATPADTLHTVIWTAVNGDVDTLVPMLSFDPESRVAAEALLASLSEANRTQYSTVEKLIATMISGRVSTDLNQATMIEQSDEQPDFVNAKFRLQRLVGNALEMRDVTFRFQRAGTDWKLLVPKSAIAEYKRSLETQ